MFTGKTDHSHKMQLAPLGVFISDAVEKLQGKKNEGERDLHVAFWQMLNPSGKQKADCVRDT